MSKPRPRCGLENAGEEIVKRILVSYVECKDILGNRRSMFKNKMRDVISSLERRGIQDWSGQHWRARRSIRTM